jgi:photosystem II stability/assembly factor-like uncharacterized protein
MVISATDPNVLVLGTSNGLYRSADGGKTWSATGPKGIDATSVAQTGKTIFAGGVAGAGPSPVIRKGGGRVAADGSAWLAISTDGGKTWSRLQPHGLPNVSVQALAVDPTRNTDLYALLNTGALYRSTDGARSFRLVSASLGIVPWALAITQKKHFVGGDMDMGPHVSVNGRRWLLTPYTDARGGHMVMEYAVQPGDLSHVLMTSIGIKASTDSGDSWRSALKSKVMFGPVAWAPSKSNLAYAVGFDGSIWRSDNAGKDWTKVA